MLAVDLRAIEEDHSRPEVVHVPPLELRPRELQVLAEGRRLRLTIAEFETLWALAQDLDHVIRRQVIYLRVWGDVPSYPRAVDTIVCKVRLKLHDAAPEWDFIHTHHGIGYRFAPEARSG